MSAELFGGLMGKLTAPLANNVACLDYSVAKGGALVAYRWDVEQTLSADKMVRVENTLPKV